MEWWLTNPENSSIRYYFCVPPETPEDNTKPDKRTLCNEADLNFYSTPEASRSVDVGDLQRVITGHTEASKIGQQIADEEIRFANGLTGLSSSDSSCNTSPLSALLHSNNGNNSPLASINTPGQSPLEASNGVDLIGEFGGVSAAEEQSSIMSDTSNIVNYSSPSPSMSSSILMSPQERQLNQARRTMLKLCNTSKFNFSSTQPNNRSRTL